MRTTSALLALVLASCHERSSRKSDVPSGRPISLGAAASIIVDGGVADASRAQSTAVIVAEVSTVAGELRILDLDAKRGDEFANCRFAVELGSRTVLRTDCHDERDPNQAQPRINLLRNVSTPVPPFDQVIVLQQSGMGNACNGGSLWFLGLKKDASYQVSKSIDFCGGKDPVVAVKNGSIEITLPGGPPNQGQGVTPTERWIFRNGGIVRLANR